MQPDLQDVLRIGAYQLLHLRVPDYAAVQSTVELAKQAAGPKAAGLVNAVLGRIAGGQGSQGGQGGQGNRGAESVVTAVTATDLASHYSHPGWLVARWLAEFGEGRTEALLAHNNTPPTVSLQPIGWPGEQLATALRAAGVANEPAPWGAGVRVSGVRVTTLPGYEEGAFIVQDPAQARILEFASSPPASRIWDACAAPGGKAAALARTARVTASDISRERLDRLRSTIARTRRPVSVSAADARRPPFGAVFDVVLVDAPCSATGALAKHPDARWRLSSERIGRLAALQAEILDGAAQAVRPGGRLVYITCSLEPEENEQQVDTFLERHPTFARETDDLRIFPPDAGTDGGFAARLVRRA